MPFLNELLTANGSTILGRVVFLKAIQDILVNDHVTALAVNAGGSGYVVGETFDIVGGTDVGGFVARGIVTEVAAGVVQACKVTSAGAYSTLPGATGATTTNASGVGTGLTVDLTTETARWTLDRSTYVDDATDFECLFTSVKATNAPTIGFDTYTSGGDEGIRLLTATGYSGTDQITAQPGGSTIDDCRIAVPGNDPELFLSTTERRVNVVSRNGNDVKYGAVGFFIPLTNDEATYPFPGIAVGNHAAVQPHSAQYSNTVAGIVFPGTVAEPYEFRDNLSTEWFTIAGDDAFDHMMWPAVGDDQVYNFTHAPTVNGFNTNPFGGQDGAGIFRDDAGGWFEGGTGDGLPGVAALGINNRSSFVVDAHILKNVVGAVEVVGIVDGFSAVHGRGLTAFEEIASAAAGTRYIVFPDTNAGDVYRWVAMEIL